ncbi:MAG: hypothetical protein KAS71_04475 [Bacteroidales bacterium]|nr:hypothetical protein [Bacteroidales bacterium]
MKKNWIRKIVGGLSLTSALFVFQACYGTPQDFEFDVLIEGQVKSKTSGIPIKGIKVSVANNMQFEYTNNEGRFSFYTEIIDNMKILFEDIDSIQNGTFLNRDTILTNIEEKVFLDIILEEK